MQRYNKTELLLVDDMVLVVVLISRRTCLLSNNTLCIVKDDKCGVVVVSIELTALWPRRRCTYCNRSPVYYRVSRVPQFHNDDDGSERPIA